MPFLNDPVKALFGILERRFAKLNPVASDRLAQGFLPPSLVLGKFSYIPNDHTVPLVDKAWLAKDLAVYLVLSQGGS